MFCLFQGLKKPMKNLGDKEVIYIIRDVHRRREQNWSYLRHKLNKSYAF